MSLRVRAPRGSRINSALSRGLCLPGRTFPLPRWSCIRCAAKLGDVRAKYFLCRNCNNPTFLTTRVAGCLGVAGVANPWLALLRMALRSSCSAEVSNPAAPGHDFSEAGFRALVCCGASAGVLLRANRNMRPCQPSPSFGIAFDISQRRALMRNSYRLCSTVGIT
jgi:hypothetical protein